MTRRTETGASRPAAAPLERRNAPADDPAPRPAPLTPPAWPSAQPPAPLTRAIRAHIIPRIERARSRGQI